MLEAADVNLVNRVLLVVTGYENQVHTDEIMGRSWARRT